MGARRLRYNNATAYALAVGHLSDRIRGFGPFVQSWPKDEKPLGRKQREELQRLLTARGFSTGGTDGVDAPEWVQISPDGKNLYVAGTGDDALAVFQRDPATGGLAFVEAVRDGYAEPIRVGICHCRMCQRATAGAFAGLADVPEADFAWTKGTPKAFQSSSVAERHFCGDCGTPLSYHQLGGANMEILLGAFDDPAALDIGRHDRQQQVPIGRQGIQPGQAGQAHALQRRFSGGRRGDHLHRGREHDVSAVPLRRSLRVVTSQTRAVPHRGAA